MMREEQKGDDRGIREQERQFIHTIGIGENVIGWEKTIPVQEIWNHVDNDEHWNKRSMLRTSCPVVDLINEQAN